MKTHCITLSVLVDGADEWAQVYEVLTAEALTLGQTVKDITVTSYLIDEPVLQDETFSEETLAKVRVALRESGMPEIMITDTINKMQNVGILFRERSS